jgi:hypothetical protein
MRTTVTPPISELGRSGERVCAWDVASCVSKSAWLATILAGEDFVEMT